MSSLSPLSAKVTAMLGECKTKLSNIEKDCTAVFAHQRENEDTFKKEIQEKHAGAEQHLMDKDGEVNRMIGELRACQSFQEVEAVKEDVK